MAPSCSWLLPAPDIVNAILRNGRRSFLNMSMRFALYHAWKIALFFIYDSFCRYHQVS